MTEPSKPMINPYTAPAEFEVTRRPEPILYAGFKFLLYGVLVIPACGLLGITLSMSILVFFYRDASLKLNPSLENLVITLGLCGGLLLGLSLTLVAGWRLIKKRRKLLAAAEVARS